MFIHNNIKQKYPILMINRHIACAIKYTHLDIDKLLILIREGVLKDPDFALLPHQVFSYFVYVVVVVCDVDGLCLALLVAFGLFEESPKFLNLNITASNLGKQNEKL